MPASYPASIVTSSEFPADITDDTNSITGTPRTGLKGFLATLLNRHNEELVAVQTELGVNPSGSFIDAAARFNQVTTARKTSDQTISTAAMANVTDLAFPVANGLAYTFRFMIIYQAAATTTGFGLTLTTPAFSRFAATVRIPRGTEMANAAVPALANLEHVQFLNTSGENVHADTTPAANADFIATVDGILIPSAAGTLQLQARPEVAANVIVRQGSHAVLWTG